MVIESVDDSSPASYGSEVGVGSIDISSLHLFEILYYFSLTKLLMYHNVDFELSLIHI